MLVYSAFPAPALASPSPVSPVATNSKPSTAKTAQKQTANKASSEQPTLRLYKGYFPYHACLQVTINQVIKKPERVLLLKATINDVYRGNYKKGSTLNLTVDDNGATPTSAAPAIDSTSPTSFTFLSTLKNTKQIVAFNIAPKWDPNPKIPGAKDRVCNLWIPYAGRGFTQKDLTQLKTLITDSPTQPAKAKAAFQKLLETKWTPDRINDYCRPETQRNWLSPFDGTGMIDWTGTLHASKASTLKGKTIEWLADVSHNSPILYTINISSPDQNYSGWDLQLADPSIVEWTDQDFLLFRVKKSIELAAFALASLNKFVQPAESDYLHLFSVTGTSVAKDQSGKVTACLYRLDNGKTLTALLTDDRSQSVDKILIDGKFDPGWTAMYKDYPCNLKKCKDIVQQNQTKSGVNQSTD
ncbi:MAG: hypothetical protein IPI39_12165 [Candidatus Obscuribacter sp.]|nr:hypothetical protein [Candidatus Obscuribacter sp.]